jgi:peroxiredoxin
MMQYPRPLCRALLVFYRGGDPFCHRQLADYRDRYAQIRAAGASVAAVSVDTPAESEALLAQISLAWCDTLPSIQW